MVLLKRHFLQTVLLLFTACYLLTVFAPSVWSVRTGAVLLLIILIISLPRAKIQYQIPGLMLFCTGGILLIKSDLSFSQWITAFSSNNGLVTFFIGLPLLSFTLAYDDYQPALRKFSKRYIHSTIQYGNFTAILSFILSSFINLGSLPIVKNLMSSSSFFEKDKTLLYRGMMRGNTASVLWSPNYVATAVILTGTGLPWIKTLPAGPILALGFILVNWINMRMTLKPDQVVESADVECSQLCVGKLLKLSVVLFSLIILVAFLNFFTGLSILVIIPIAAIIYPLAWAIIERKIEKYKTEFKNYYNLVLPNIKNEIVLFAAAGFLGKSLEMSGAGKVISAFLHLDSIHQPCFFILAVFAVMMLVSLVGIHPIVSSTAIASTIVPSTVGLSLLAFTMVLLIGYSLSVMISPFSGISLVLSGMSKKNPWTVSAVYNCLFALVMALFYSLVIPLVI